jgi:2-iminobutanoate/2-iminopropanoate deaminase
LAPSTWANGLLFTSGQLAFDEHGRVAGDIAEQTTVVLQRIAEVVESQGLSRSDIKKTTVWLTDRSLFPAFNSAYAAFFGEHRPARSTVVSQLAIDGALIEIEAVAGRS